MNNANGGNILFHFKGDTSGLQKTISSVGSMTKSILVATGITKALSAAWNMVSSSTGDAIERFDQLNAFPKVMSSMNISAEKSQKAINKLSDRLKGLPTTLNQATKSVSRFVAVNEDVDKSTEMFLAVNNAIIAGNAPIENQQYALEQLTQAYSRGKPDINEWKSLMIAMPGQMKQVAKAMGFIKTDDLREALISGSVSMDEFMETIMRLNTEGVDGFANFQEQANNAVGGIKTAITNMKTAITRGVANIIDSLDKGLKSGGVDKGIYGIIGKVGEGFEKGLTSIGKMFGENLGKLLKGEITAEKFTKNITTFLLNGLTKGIELLTEQIPTVVPIIVEALVGIINAISDSLPTLVPALVNLTVALVNALTTDEIMTKLGEAGVKFAVGLTKGLVKGIENMTGDTNFTQTVIEVSLGNLANTFISFGIPVFTRMGRSLMVGLFMGIAEAMGMDEETKKAVREELQGFIEKPLEFLFNIGKQIIDGLYNGILEALGIKKPGKNIKKDVKDNVGNDANTWLYSVGKDLVQGLINGITAMYFPFLSVVNQIAGLVGQVIEKKNKIHSPSRLMEWYGEMLGEGYINGIDKMKEAISQTATNTFSISPQLANSMSLNNTPNIVVNNYVNNETDPLGQTVSQIKTFANGAKNDYNYGMGV